MYNGKIGIIGAGYVGLTTAVAFAEKYNVAVHDSNSSLLGKIDLGIAHFYEPGLDESLKKLVDENFLHTISENRRLFRYM